MNCGVLILLSAPSPITKGQIEESLRNAEENRTKILEIKKEKAGQENERVAEHVKKHEEESGQKTEELANKIKEGMRYTCVFCILILTHSGFHLPQLHFFCSLLVNLISIYFLT